MTLLSGNTTGAVRLAGCDDRYCYWNHPWSLIRGLIHSDGCRAINKVTSNGVRYAYSRYFFSNESRDILGIMGDALDRVGVAWRFNRPNCISIARRPAVATMDAHVGPKA